MIVDQHGKPYVSRFTQFGDISPSATLHFLSRFSAFSKLISPILDKNGEPILTLPNATGDTITLRKYKKLGESNA